MATTKKTKTNRALRALAEEVTEQQAFERAIALLTSAHKKRGLAGFSKMAGAAALAYERAEAIDKGTKALLFLRWISTAEKKPSK